MANCTQINPCSCTGSYVGAIGVVSACSTNCLCLGNILVEACDSVGPCEQVGTVDISCFNLTCTTDFVIRVEEVFPLGIITVTSITNSTLTFTTTNEANAGDRVELRLYASCSEDCGVIADYGGIVIYIKDDCEGVVCIDGETCNKCTAVCEPIEEDIIVE